MVFCNQSHCVGMYTNRIVTILILIDGFLQFGHNISKGFGMIGHNPYFNRWFSAIEVRSNYQKYAG